MTAFSAKVDEHGQWFDTPLPGRLSDVFGLKTNAFYDSTPLKFDLDGKSIDYQRTSIRGARALNGHGARSLHKYPGS